MRTVKIKFYCFSADEGRLFFAENETTHVLQLVNFLEIATKFKTDVEAMTAYELWKTIDANAYNYDLAPKLATADLEQFEIARNMLRAVDWAAPGAVGVKVRDPTKPEKLNIDKRGYH